MSYTKQTWEDNNRQTPLSAARMNHIEDGIDSVANGGSRAFVGSADPSSGLTAATEYVWFQTDGSGTLLDILIGVA